MLFFIKKSQSKKYGGLGILIEHPKYLTVSIIENRSKRLIKVPYTSEYIQKYKNAFYYDDQTRVQLKIKPNTRVFLYDRVFPSSPDTFNYIYEGGEVTRPTREFKEITPLHFSPGGYGLVLYRDIKIAREEAFRWWTKNAFVETHSPFRVERLDCEVCYLVFRPGLFITNPYHVIGKRNISCSSEVLSGWSLIPGRSVSTVETYSSFLRDNYNYLNNWVYRRLENSTELDQSVYALRKKCINIDTFMVEDYNLQGGFNRSGFNLMGMNQLPA